MISQVANELSTLEWALGIVITILIAVSGGAFAHLYTQINALSQRLDSDRKSTRDDVTAGDNQLRQEIGEIRTRVMDQPTKDDMRDMERRLTSQLAVGRNDMEVRLVQAIRDHQRDAESGTINRRD